MPCVSCKHWQMRQSPEMARQGFASCEHGPKWMYWPDMHECEKHKELGKEAVGQRIDFLHKKLKHYASNPTLAPARTKP